MPIPPPPPAGLTRMGKPMRRASARICSSPSSTPEAAPTGMPYWATSSRARVLRSEEHTSELQSLMRISYAVFCLKKTKHKKHNNINQQTHKLHIHTHTHK